MGHMVICTFITVNMSTVANIQSITHTILSCWWKYLKSIKSVLIEVPTNTKIPSHFV